MRLSVRRRARIKELKLWQLSVLKLRIAQERRRVKTKSNAKWQDKLILNAIECQLPFDYKPKVPPYPFEATSAKDYAAETPLINVSDFEGEQCAVADLMRGDVVRFNGAYALIRDASDENVLQVQIAYSSLIQQFGQYSYAQEAVDYGIRYVDTKDILDLALVERGHEVLELNHFDVQL